MSVAAIMMNQTNKPAVKADDYFTPKSAWNDIKHLIPEGVIWEPFYGDGQSGRDLTELGFKVIHNEGEDFFEQDPKGSLCLSNPPFSLTRQVLGRLVEMEMPFILIMPTSKMNTQYFRALFKDDKRFQIIIPKKRIHFISPEMKETGKKSSCYFDCYYYCWKINLPEGINWL